MATVILPRSLVALFAGAERQVAVDGGTVRELIEAMDARWPGMFDRLCDAGPQLRAYINVFVDGRPADLSTPVDVGAMVHILPAVAGGA
jgi:molybdopterin synthase sulfur carrier subunit